MADLTPATGKLLYLSWEEAALIAALRSDPLQLEHVASIQGAVVTLQHPISERLDGDVFACPLLEQILQYGPRVTDGRYVVYDEPPGATFMPVAEWQADLG